MRSSKNASDDEVEGSGFVPRWLCRLIERIAVDDEADQLIGDLEEAFGWGISQGTVRARLEMIRNAASSVLYAVEKRVRRSRLRFALQPLTVTPLVWAYLLDGIPMILPDGTDELWDLRLTFAGFLLAAIINMILAILHGLRITTSDALWGSLRGSIAMGLGSLVISLDALLLSDPSFASKLFTVTFLTLCLGFGVYEEWRFIKEGREDQKPVSPLVLLKLHDKLHETNEEKEDESQAEKKAVETQGGSKESEHRKS